MDGARVRGDQIRLLAARSEYGYVDRASLALPHEPEAISRAEQRAQTQLADRRARQRRLAAWRPARSLLLAGVVAFEAAADPRSRSDLKVVQRIVKRVDERLGR